MYMERLLWTNPRKGEAVFAEQDTTKGAIRADAHAVAWKRKLLSKLTPDIIEHVPRELSRAIWFFISHGGTIKRRLASTQYFRSPITKVHSHENVANCNFI